MNPTLTSLFQALNVPGYGPQAPAPAVPAQTPASQTPASQAPAPATTTTLIAPQPASVPEGSDSGKVVQLRPPQASAPQTPAITGFDRLKNFVDGLAKRIEGLTTAFDAFKTSTTQGLNGLGVKLVRIEGELGDRVDRLEKRPTATANIKGQLLELLKNPPADVAIELRIGSERHFLEILEDRTRVIRGAAATVGVGLNEADIRRIVKWQNFSADAVERAFATQKARAEASDVLDRMARQHQVTISREIGRQLVDGVVSGEVTLDLLEAAVAALADNQHAAQEAVERRRQEDRRKQNREREESRTHTSTSMAGALQAAGFVANGEAKAPEADPPIEPPPAALEEVAAPAGIDAPPTEPADAAEEVADVDPDAAPPADKPAPRRKAAKPLKKGKARRDGEDGDDPADGE